MIWRLNIFPFFTFSQHETWTYRRAGIHTFTLHIQLSVEQESSMKSFTKPHWKYNLWATTHKVLPAILMALLAEPVLCYGALIPSHSSFGLTENRDCSRYKQSTIVNFIALPNIWMYCSRFIWQKKKIWPQVDLRLLSSGSSMMNLINYSILLLFCNFPILHVPLIHCHTVPGNT